MCRLSLLCTLLTTLSVYAQAAKEPKPGEVVEVEITKGMKMKFCWVPSGKAQLGSEILGARHSDENSLSRKSLDAEKESVSR